LPAANHRGKVWEPSQGSHVNRVGSPPAAPAANHRGKVWEPSQGSHVNRVGSPPALPAANHRGKVWEPSQGSHVNRVGSPPAPPLRGFGTDSPPCPPRALRAPSPAAHHRARPSGASGVVVAGGGPKGLARPSEASEAGAAGGGPKGGANPPRVPMSVSVVLIDRGATACGHVL
jgi:hypothetical protein